MAFDGCCPDCKLPGDDCPLSKYITYLTMFHFVFMSCQFTTISSAVEFPKFLFVFMSCHFTTISSAVEFPKFLVVDL